MVRRSGIALVLVLVTAACTGGDDSGGGDRGVTTTSAGAATTVATTTTAAPATTTTTASPATSAPTGGGADWTFLVYLMGDTNLEPFALQDMVEMSSAQPNDRVSIVALVDRHPAFSNEGVLNLPDWEDTKLVEIRDGVIVELAADVELNLGSSDTLAAFIDAGISSFPADHYALVFWDHGAGWPGMGPDETNGQDILDLADISDGLTRGLAAAGVDSIDLIGFDACLMSTYEVANVVAPFADFMLASQELEPGHGWNYEALQVLSANPDTGPEQLGRAIIDGFAAQAAASGTGSDITLSLLDLDRIDEFATALSAVTGTLAADPGGSASVLAGARRSLLGFGRNPDPALDTNLVDLGGLLENMAAVASDADLGAAATSARAALADVVVANTTGPATRAASGLSIYFPEVEQYFRQGYLFLTGDPQWATTLSGFFQAGKELPPDRHATFVQEQDTAPIFFFDEDGLNVFGPLSEFSVDSVIEATMFLGVVEESDVQVLYAEEWMDIVEVDGVTGVGAIHDNTFLVLSDGEDEAVAYYALNVDEESGYGLVDIPLAYVAPGTEESQDVVLSLVVELDGDGIVEEDSFTVDESGTYGALSTNPEGLIYPAVLVVEPDGTAEWVVTTEVGLWADLEALQYELVPHDPGTQLYVELSVTDYGGNTNSVTLFPVVE